MGDRHAPLLGASAHRLAEDVAEIEHAHGSAGHARDLHGRELPSSRLLHRELALLVVEFALAPAGGAFLPRVTDRGCATTGAHQHRSARPPGMYARRVARA